jgi:uncharacterized protein (DUF1778 family)|nr:DUF1778 domain-containing protein [uncultured Rhodopila sp.]
MSASNPVVSVRVTPTERDLLASAAEHAHTNLSDFVRRKALEAAEMDLADRRVVTIPAEDWEKFERWVHAPARPNAALRELAATRPVWQD